MQWNIANTSALWGLIALAIPIVIHLISRSRAEQRDFSYLALLPIEPTQQRKKLALTQKRLLLIRLLLLISIVLWLAGLVREFVFAEQATVHLVTPAWIQGSSGSERQALLQRLTRNNDKQSHYGVLLSGQHQGEHTLLSLLTMPSGNHDLLPFTNVWQSINHWLANNSISGDTRLVVYSTDAVSEFVGGKPALAHWVEWQLIAPTPSAEGSQLATPPMTVYLVGDEQQILPEFVAALASLEYIKALNLTIKIQTQMPPSLNEFDSVVVFDTDSENDSSEPEQQIYAASDFSQIRRPDFPIRLANSLFAPAIDQQVIKTARLSHDSIRSHELNNPNLQVSLDPENIPSAVKPAISSQNRTDHLSIILLILALMLVIAERVYSEKLAAMRGLND